MAEHRLKLGMIFCLHHTSAQYVISQGQTNLSTLNLPHCYLIPVPQIISPNNKMHFNIKVHFEISNCLEKALMMSWLEQCTSPEPSTQYY